MNPYLILCHLTGSICILISLFTYIFPTRKMSLMMKALLDTFSILNLTFIYIYTSNYLVVASIGTACIGFVRDIVFFFRKSQKWLDNIHWPIGFSVLFLLSLIFTYESPISLLPVFGSVISTMTLYAINQKVTKIGALVNATFYIVYYGILLPTSGQLTLFSLITYVACFIGTLVGLIILLRKEKQGNVNNDTK